MADFEIAFASIKQTTFTSPTCKVQILFSVTGPKSGIDLVQVYAVNAVDTVPSGLGDVVDTVDLTITEAQYSSQPDLPAGAALTIYLCPRSETDGILDDQVEGEYWENFCISQALITTVTIGTNAPQVSIVSVEPATALHPNQITISWSGNNYTDGQVLWGPLNNPRSNVYSFQATDKDNEPDYTGQFSASIPWNLAGQIFSFTVQVRNNIQDASLWYPTTIGARSAENFHSLGQFLKASNVQLPADVREFLHGTHSLRSLMQI